MHAQSLAMNEHLTQHNVFSKPGANRELYFAQYRALPKGMLPA